MSLFEKRNISPMLIAQMKKPFNDDNWIYELKLDGCRCIGYFEKNTTCLRNKRNMDLLPRPTLSDTPIVSKPLHMLMTVGETPFFTSDISCGARAVILSAFIPILSFARSVSLRWLTVSAPEASCSTIRNGRCRS